MKLIGVDQISEIERQSRRLENCCSKVSGSTIDDRLC